MGINYILKYSKIEKNKNKHYFKLNNISQYYVFLCIVDQINPDLMSIRDFFQNIKNSNVSKLLTGTV